MAFERLRAELTDYFGTAAFAGNPAAFFEVQTVQSASDEQLLEIAREVGIDPQEDSVW